MRGEVCKHYGIPFVELMLESGVNNINASIYYTDEIYPTDYVHPNAKNGMPQMGQLISGKIKSIL